MAPFWHESHHCFYVVHTLYTFVPECRVSIQKIYEMDFDRWTVIIDNLLSNHLNLEIIYLE